MNKMENSRRKFIYRSLNYTASFGLGSSILFLNSSSTLSRLNFTIPQLLAAYPNDKVDTQLNYLENWAEAYSYYPRAQKFLQNEVFTLQVPRGKKIILGSYKHLSLNKFCKKYGPQDCFGLDIYNYKNHSRAITKDVRDLVFNEFGRLAIGWNNTSVWSGSPRSKLSGFHFIRNNLRIGGILIENPTRYIPKDINFKQFQLLHQDDFGSIWRKVS